MPERMARARGSLAPGLPTIVSALVHLGLILALLATMGYPFTGGAPGTLDPVPMLLEPPAGQSPAPPLEGTPAIPAGAAPAEDGASPAPGAPERTESQVERRARVAEAAARLTRAGEAAVDAVPAAADAAGRNADVATPDPTRQAAPAPLPGVGSPGRAEGQAGAGSHPGQARAAPGPDGLEARLQRNTARLEGVDWLGGRLQRLSERMPAATAGMERPETRVALRALEVRGRNLQAAAAQAAAELTAARAASADASLPEAALARLREKQSLVEANARAVLAALPPVADQLPDDDARWAAFLGRTLLHLVEGEERLEPPDQAVAAPDPSMTQSPAAPAVPAGTDAPRQDRPASMSAALTAARLEQAASRGIPVALYNLAIALLEADGMAPDPGRAAGILRELARQGFRPAQIRFATAALRGEGMPADAAEALAWYSIAGANGSAEGKAQAAALAARLSPAIRAQAQRIVEQWMAQAGPQALPDQDELDRSLAQAIEALRFDQVQHLLRQGADPQALADGGRSALVGAAWRGRRGIVQLLLESGVDLRARDGEQRDALLWAAINGHGEMADDLLDLGANPNIRDGDGSTPLIRAAWNGRHDIVRRLLAAGADPRLRDAGGHTAAERAQSQGDARMLTLLGAARSPR